LFNQRKKKGKEKKEKRTTNRCPLYHNLNFLYGRFFNLPTGKKREEKEKEKDGGNWGKNQLGRRA